MERQFENLGGSGDISVTKAIVQGYNMVIDSVIRPPRMLYEMSELGPVYFELCDPYTKEVLLIQREDRCINNDRGLSLSCSHWRHIEKGQMTVKAVGYSHLLFFSRFCRLHVWSIFIQTSARAKMCSSYATWRWRWAFLSLRLTFLVQDIPMVSMSRWAGTNLWTWSVFWLMWTTMQLWRALVSMPIAWVRILQFWMSRVTIKAVFTENWKSPVVVSMRFHCAFVHAMFECWRRLFAAWS